MILLPKKRVRRFQAGGNMRYVNAGIGEQFTPIKISTPGFAPLYKAPTGSGASRSPRGTARNQGKQAKEDRLNAKGFANDIKHAYAWRDKITSRMTSRAQDPNYMNSPEYENDFAEARQADLAISQLESIEKNFKESLNKKTMDPNARAIHNDKALVYDKSENNYKVVGLKEALSTKIGTPEENVKRYNIETIATAQGLRGTSDDFNYFTGGGKDLQDMIINSYNKDLLYKTIDNTYKQAGISKGTDSYVNLSNNTQLDVDEWYRYITDKLSVTGTTSKTKWGNEDQLNAGIKNLTDRVVSNKGTLSALRDMAIGNIINDGVEVGDMSNNDLEETIEKYIQRDLLTRMQLFLEKGYDDKIKPSSKKTKTGTDKNPDDQAVIHTTNFMASIAYPTKTEKFQVKSLAGKNRPSTALLSVAEIANSTAWLEGGFKHSGLNGDEEKIYQIGEHKSLIDVADAADLKKGLSIGDGRTLAELNDGHGVQSAVLPTNQKLKVYMTVPVYEEPDSGKQRVYTDYIAYVDLFNSTVDRIAKEKGILPNEAGEIAHAVWTDWRTTDPKFDEFAQRMVDGSVRWMSVLSGYALVPEVKHRLGVETGDAQEFGKYLTEENADADYYKRHASGDNYTNYWVARLLQYDDEVYKVQWFLPIKTNDEIQHMQFEGDEKVTMKASELKRIQETGQTQRRNQERPRGPKDLLGLSPKI